MEATVTTTAVSTGNNENRANRPALYHYAAGRKKIVAILTGEIISNMIHCIPAHN